MTRLRFQGPVFAVAFSADGRYVETAYISAENRDLSVARDLLRPQDLIDEACSRLTSNLTAEEWKRYMPSDKRRQTCPNLP